MGYLIPASGTGQPKPISPIPQSVPLSSFPDGKSILGYVITPDAGRDLWVFGLDGHDTPLLQTPANERAPSASPDGRAIVYVSDGSGEDRVYVRLYPDVGQAWTISGNGATAPRWNRNGREIFFIQNSQIMAASIDVSDGVRVGAPRALFSATAYEQDPFAIRCTTSPPTAAFSWCGAVSACARGGSSRTGARRWPPAGALDDMSAA